ncbi:related to NADPH-dependent FMN and FAD containing oxidoreductase (NR1) [Ustilago trichophora]|uniref:NADPH-dependent diflavin oxidoreductase 1 n=1 Tax=Ustilago trichophora TaxID=86804 RepID=A0A5C3EI51_9BASI|nr:related to NADPH-dependent FMN and FAD containing oxidoreductase (NR1) [Ustilago trichophora]
MSNMDSIQASTSSLASASLNGDDSNRQITILYMTQTGTSADIAARIARQARRKRFSVTLSDISSYDVTDLVSESLVLFLVSTTGQGEFPTASRGFWNFLLRKGIPEDILADVNFAAFGLGDTTYPRFCWPVRLLSRRLKQLGASEVVGHGEGDEMHYLGLEGGLGPWLEEFWGKVDEMLPLEKGVEEIGRDELLPPATKVVEMQSGVEREGKEQEIEFSKHLEEQGWTTSKLRTNERMTAADHFQDVRLLEFEDTTPQQSNGNAGDHHLTAATYRPGDVLCLHPVNDPASVDEILTRLSLSPSTLITVSGPTVPSTVPQAPHTLTLRTLFTYHLDFTSVPTRSFFDQIRLFSPSGSLEREKLDEYCGIYPPEELAKGANPQDGIDEMFEYAQRPRRTIKEVLEEFKSVRIPLEYIADVLPWIKPREFSIASPPPTSSEGEAIQLSVAIVKYKTRLRKARTGLCTKWLASLPVGTDVPILVKEGYLTLPPEDVPLVLVGPGTGCAPLRSLVMERLSSSSSRPEIHLFLGFRNRAKDYLFSQDWEKLSVTHENFHLHTAFSRDSEDKVYVQDLVKGDKEVGQVLWNAIVQRNAWIIVAGASGKMPEQVRGAFEELAQMWGGMDGDQAKRFLDSLERQRRWQEECWS